MIAINYTLLIVAWAKTRDALIIAYFVAVGMPIELYGDYQNCPFLK